MRTRRLGSLGSLPVFAMALGYATHAAAQQPTDAGAPPVPDAVSGDPLPGEKPPEPTPPEPPPAAPEPPPAAPAAPAAPTLGATTGAPDAALAGDKGDYSRRGFFFSFGLGTSIIRWDLELRTGDSLSYLGGVTELVPATLLKIGYGIAPQTAVHLTNRIAWLSHNDPVAIDHHERIWTMSSMTGLGVTHFLDPERRSWYVGADLGVSQWLAFEDIGLDVRDIGIGACLAVGNAFFPGLSFEHSVCWGSVVSNRRDADSGAEVDAELGSPLTASFTVNYLK
jgi:hypothetical protein